MFLFLAKYDDDDDGFYASILENHSAICGIALTMLSNVSFSG